MSYTTLSVEDVIDGQRVRPAMILLLAVATLTMLSDGFDLSAIGYVGPELIKQWHVRPPDLVPIFSAGIIGLLLGAPLLGFFGDRFGRKKGILVGLAVVAGFSLITMGATTLWEFAVLRFITGLGLGGIIPNIVALVAEAAPKRLRGRFIVIVNFGVPAGISIPGLVAAVLVPQYGWPALLLVGGLLPLAIAIVLALTVAESVKYLARNGDRDDQVRRIVQAMRPDLPLEPATRILASTPSASTPSASIPSASIPSGSPRGMFAGGLAAITPLLWVVLAANQMANFFSLTWLPTLLQSTGSSVAQASVNASLFSIGGLFGGLVLTFVVDRLGVIPMAILLLIGVPLMASIGLPGLQPGVFAAIIAGAGFCVTGVNFNMSAVLGMIYPTPVRSLGTGWAQAVGRLGSLSAPLIGGALLGAALPMQDLLLAPAMSLAVGAAAAIMVAFLCVRRFGGTRLQETAAPTRHLAPAVQTGA